MDKNKIAFVTCNRLVNGTEEDNEVARVLKTKGYYVSFEVWNNKNVEWHKFNAIILRSCWDYHLHPIDFLSWLNEIEKDKLKIWNSVELVKWNMNKNYLKELSSYSISIPPTVWVTSKNNLSLDRIIRKIGWSDVIIKPIISAGAFATFRIKGKPTILEENEFEKTFRNRGFMVQQFLPEICKNGEWSLIFLNNEFSHSVLKFPKTGDFRVQGHCGGTLQYLEAPIEVINTARKIIEKVGKKSLYVRVDGVEVDGKFVLMELEMIEPSLYLKKRSKPINLLVDSIINNLEEL